MDKRLWKNADFVLLAVVYAIIIYGLVTIASATHVTQGGGNNPYMYVERQAIWAVISTIAVLVMMTIHYEDLLRMSKYIYGLNLLLLLLVEIAGKVGGGAQSWLGFGSVAIQPSEFAKIFIIITLSNLLASKQGKLESFRDLVPVAIHVGIPMLLILVQPDLGTALVFIAITLGMLYAAGTRPLLLVIIIIIGLVLAIGGVWAHVQGYIHLPLKDYQLKRLIIFTNPDLDPAGAGYHVRQSLIAIGSGGLWGKGLFQGTQNQLNFLPEQHTDFIFSVVGEELGFVGAAGLLTLLMILVFRGLRIAAQARDIYGVTMAAGIVSMYLFHILENVGMTISIMPITGIPLPFFSYGGSNLLANMLGVGILQSIYMRRQKILF